MHVHILGICGTFMAGVAAIARAAGHRVTGSDQAVYPPMSDQLAGLGIAIVEGYEPEQLDPAPDVVVVGNVMSRGMSVVEAMLSSGIPYMSGPQWLAESVLHDQQVIAVAGTHGKTTTTSLLAWILETAGLEPGFLIGGVPADFPVSARLGGGRCFVIEADEYDTAFFDKRAKFLHYRPDAVVINNLEFDHADIYPDLAAIQWQFHQLLRGLPGNGSLVVNAGDAATAELLDMGCWTPVTSFASGKHKGADWTANAGDGELVICHGERELGRTRWQMSGDHNAENAIAALLAARHAGVDPETALAAIGSFGGVRRRLELRGEFGGVSLFDDFAHHPTAIRRTIDALRSRDARGRILIVFEPRSNTMKMGVHRKRLGAAFSGADEIWILRPAGLDWDLGAAFGDRPVRICDDVDSIADDVAACARSGDRVVVMSNGGCGGIHALLEKSLDRTPALG